MYRTNKHMNLETVLLALVISAIGALGILAIISAATATHILSWNPVCTVLSFLFLTITICAYLLFGDSKKHA